MASTLGTVQPFRYRGYVYDEETGLYDLRSRSFNIAWSRFIQTDNILTDLANLYAYCENSPTNKVDPNGNISAIARVDGGVAPDDFKRFWKALGAAIGASVAVSVSALTVANTKTTDQTRSVTKVNLPDPNPDPNDVRKYPVYFYWMTLTQYNMSVEHVMLERVKLLIKGILSERDYTWVLLYPD